MANGIIVDPAAVGDFEETEEILRFYSPSWGKHIYTNNQDEINALNQAESGWLQEGVAFLTGENATRDVYRFYNAASGDHLMTWGSIEIDALLTNPDSGYVLEGVVFQIYDSSYDTVDINRLYNPTTGEHFYTTDDEEALTLIGQGSFVPEGVLGCALA